MLINMSVFIYFILKALVITLICEALVIFIFNEKHKWPYIICLGMNLITNPLMNFILLKLDSNFYYLGVFIFELLVFLIEGIGYSLYYKNIKKGLSISFFCNLASYVIGLML